MRKQKLAGHKQWTRNTAEAEQYQNSPRHGEALSARKHLIEREWFNEIQSVTPNLSKTRSASQDRGRATE